MNLMATFLNWKTSIRQTTKYGMPYIMNHKVSKQQKSCLTTKGTITNIPLLMLNSKTDGIFQRQENSANSMLHCPMSTAFSHRMAELEWLTIIIGQARKVPQNKHGLSISMTLPIKADFFKRLANSHSFMSDQFGVRKLSLSNLQSVKLLPQSQFAPVQALTCKLRAHNTHQAKDGKSHQMKTSPMVKHTTAKPLTNHTTAGI